MTFGVTNVINCINQSALRTDLTALELLQLTGSDCQFDRCAVFSAACQASLPTASCNTGRFVYITSECKYYFSNGSIWTDDVDSQLVSFIFTWGAGGNGSRGDNTSTGCTSSPGSVVGGFTDWCQISVGGSSVSNSGFGFGVRTNGTLWGWGYGYQGVLGSGVAGNRCSPVSVAGGFTDWCQVSAGDSSHAVAVRQNGTAWGWGCNNYGKLGDNTTTAKSSPVSVVGGFTDWCQVSAGSYFSLGVRQNGTAWSWGKGYVLGNNCTGTANNRSSPVSVAGGFTDWCQVSAGNSSSLAVRQNGTAWGWGSGSGGKLGDNCTSQRCSPVSVVGGFTDWCYITAYDTGLAVRTNGSLWAWGRNNYGQLGDNSTVSKSSPVSVVGGFTDWCQVSGDNQSLGVRTNGTAWAWGKADTGQLGDNTTVSKSSPVSVVGGYTDWCQVSAAAALSAGIRKTKGF